MSKWKTREEGAGRYCLLIFGRLVMNELDRSVFWHSRVVGEILKYTPGLKR